MAATQESAPPHRPAELPTGLGIVDWAQRLSIPPALLGIASAAGVFALGLALAPFSGWLPKVAILSSAFWASVRGWFDLAMSIQIGYGVAASVWIVRATLRDWDRLAPTMEATPTELSRAREEMVGFEGSARHVIGAVAIAAGVGVNFFPGNWPEGRPPLTDAFFVWTTIRTSLLIWVVSRTIFVDFTLARRFSRLGAGLVRVDLLEPEALAVFGRRGLRSVLLLMGFSVLFAVMTLAPFGRRALVIGLVLTVVFGILAFFAPVRGAHRRMAAARDAELARVRAAIRRHMAGASETPVAGSGLADLLAWEARLERIHTWPFDAGTLVRFALYTAIGVGSWVGGAIVERALGAALD